MFKQPIINTLLQIGGKTVSVLISLLTTSLLTRRLGSEVYGAFIFITSIFLFLDSLADFGTKVIGVREASGKDKDKERKRVWSQVGWLRIIMTLVAFVVGLVLIKTLKGFRGYEIEAVVALLMIWMTSIAGTLEIIWQTKMRMDFKVVVELMFPTLFLAIIYGVKGELSLIWVFSVYLIARFISLIVAMWTVGKVVGFWKWEKVDLKAIRRLLAETWPMGIYLLVFASYDRAVDSIMIQHYQGIREVAWYGLAYKIYTTLLQPAYFFVTSIFPLMSRKMAERRKFFGYAFAILLISGLVGAISIFLLAPWIIQVLGGSEFLPSVGILRWLLIAMVFSYLGHLSGFGLISRGGQIEILKFGLVVLIFNVGANIVMIPRYGMYGAAAVTGATEALSFGFSLYNLWRKR